MLNFHRIIWEEGQKNHEDLGNDTRAPRLELETGSSDRWNDLPVQAGRSLFLRRWVGHDSDLTLKQKRRENKRLWFKALPNTFLKGLRKTTEQLPTKEDR